MKQSQADRLPAPRPGQPHCEPGHGPLPRGGDVRRSQLRAAAGGAEVFRSEVDDQELGHKSAALNLPAPWAAALAVTPPHALRLAPAEAREPRSHHVPFHEAAPPPHVPTPAVAPKGRPPCLRPGALRLDSPPLLDLSLLATQAAPRAAADVPAQVEGAIPRWIGWRVPTGSQPPATRPAPAPLAHFYK